jgi:hypothetical protein
MDREDALAYWFSAGPQGHSLYNAAPARVAATISTRPPMLVIASKRTQAARETASETPALARLAAVEDYVDAVLGAEGGGGEDFDGMAWC